MSNPLEFVKIWQSSASVQEVVAKLGITKSRACNTAWFYRKNGVPLKKFPKSNPKPRIDYKALIEAVNELGTN